MMVVVGRLMADYLSIIGLYLTRKYARRIAIYPNFFSDRWLFELEA